VETDQAEGGGQGPLEGGRRMMGEEK